ncbi:glycosyltransferase [Falsigemmobacter faecalis]|uniref:Glycosyltransferase n=1 Tax=Falsigemmobacter faecalis TaxID=2488730 RepID=A0A3P3D3E0_9RHOB|nr:glycosyltransferase [Falsigemmobacter faecalis]RRH68304.1 glycosyltransferase [Falsigemmobacter faecalis]
MKVLHVVNAWPDDKHPSKAIFIKEQIERLPSSIEVDVHHIGNDKGILKYIRSVFRVRKIKSNYDLIHAHHVFSSILCIASGVKKSHLITSFLNNRGFNALNVGVEFSKIIEKFCAKRSVVNIYKNESFEDIRTKEDILLPNSVEAKSFPEISSNEARRRLGLNDGLITLLFVSANNLYRQSKRYDRFSEIVSELEGRGIHVNVLTMVSVSRENVYLYFNAADYLICTSDYEGSPNAVKEALYCGAAIVSVDVGDVKHQAGGVNNCIIMDSYDASVAVEHIIRIGLRSENSRNVTRCQYRNRIEGDNDADKIRDAYIKAVKIRENRS